MEEKWYKSAFCSNLVPGAGFSGVKTINSVTDCISKRIYGKKETINFKRALNIDDFDVCCFPLGFLEVF